MFSANLWDVSRLIHEERLEESRRNMLVRQLVPGASPLQRAHRVLSRLLFFL
jgi:hypothetical protein